MLSLITMSVLGCRGYESTLNEMKVRLGTELGWIRKRDVPSPSALSQARLKLDATMCASLVSDIYAMCTSARSGASLGYGGFRLLAVDGTKLALPAYQVMQDHFGCPSQGVGRELAGPQASLTVLWDVGANQPVNWRLGPYKVSERVHAYDLIGGVGNGDLVLGDRGFPSRRWLTRLWRQRAQVLVRMRTTGGGVMREVAAFLASQETDLVTTMQGWDEHTEQANPELSLPIRLIRVVLPDGSSAIYLTTLTDIERHPSSAILELYAQRWRIETAFREMKIWHGLERFHSRRVDGIAQEVAAIMIFQRPPVPVAGPVATVAPVASVPSTPPTTTVAIANTAPSASVAPTSPDKPAAVAMNGGGGVRPASTGTGKVVDPSIAALLGNNTGPVGPGTGPASGGGGGSQAALSSDAIESVVRMHSTSVKRQCWERGGSTMADVNVKVHLTISGNGTVKDTSATGNDPAIAKCIENSVRMWTFPASGGNTDVDIPFHFLRQ